MSRTYNLADLFEEVADHGEQCPVGVTGKLASTGHIPLGYFKDPDKTAATFPTYAGKRWVIPGDFARIEQDASVSLLGRGSVSINSGGEKIYPEEVEAALNTVLSDFKTPRTVLFVDTVQRTPSGKADYKWAKETALSLLAAG